jgi:hypothetical protein
MRKYIISGEIYLGQLVNYVPFFKLIVHAWGMMKTTLGDNGDDKRMVVTMRGW